MTIVQINIWDDYYEDNYVPEGKIQETYAYIEAPELEQDEQKVCLENLMQFIIQQKLLPKTVGMAIVFYDSAIKYPNLVGTENVSLLFKRWELRFKYLTHAFRETLVEGLQGKLKIFGSTVIIYSES